MEEGKDIFLKRMCLMSQSFLLQVILSWSLLLFSRHMLCILLFSLVDILFRGMTLSPALLLVIVFGNSLLSVRRLILLFYCFWISCVVSGVAFHPLIHSFFSLLSDGSHFLSKKKNAKSREKVNRFLLMVVYPLSFCWISLSISV